MGRLRCNVPQGIHDVQVGMEARARFTFTSQDMDRFSDLAEDNAPIHFDDDFAVNQGYARRVVFGLFVASRFSGLLGVRLPGPFTVIHSARFDVVNPVYVEEPIDYVVKVRQVSLSTKAVLLDLMALKGDGEVVLRGSAQCGFRR